MLQMERLHRFFFKVQLFIENLADKLHGLRTAKRHQKTLSIKQTLARSIASTHGGCSSGCQPLILQIGQKTLRSVTTSHLELWAGTTQPEELERATATKDLHSRERRAFSDESDGTLSLIKVCHGQLGTTSP